MTFPAPRRSPDPFAVPGRLPPLLRRTALFLAVVPLVGCTTLITLGESETRNKIYSGTTRQLALKCAHATCIDFPFSLVADTLLLPITLPWTAINHFGSPADPAAGPAPAAPAPSTPAPSVPAR